LFARSHHWPGQIELLFRIVCALIASLLSGAAVFWLLLQLPCNWFGSNFEGSCGYRGLWLALGGAMIMTCFMGLFLVILAVRRPATIKA